MTVPAPLVHQEAVMGTVVTIQLHTPVPAAQAEPALSEAVKWLHWVDETFSTYKAESEVNRFDRGELAAGAASAELQSVIALCYLLAEETGGFFDAWAGGRFDPSGVVKGWSIDRASEILASHGISDHLVDAGGDLLMRGRPAGAEQWRVGVRHPLQGDAFSAALCIAEGAVATSGTYERGFHVLNPFTGKPATELASVTVVGPELATADAYATAALAMGAEAPAWLGKLSGYEAQVITPEGRGWSTTGFQRLQVGGAGPAQPSPTASGAGAVQPARS
jgi:thiamine biosynthesis lipoprotein